MASFFISKSFQQIIKKNFPICKFFNIFARTNDAGVVKLVDTLDLGSSASRRGGSSPFTRTSEKNFSIFFGKFFLFDKK